MDSRLKDKEVLCLLDTRRIQRFMFRSNTFADTVGASDLVKHILQDAVTYALHHIDEPLAADEYDMSNQPDAPIPFLTDPTVKFQLMVFAAGNALFLARTGELAQKIVRKVSRYYLDHAYSLNVAASIVEKTDDFGNDVSNLYRNLNVIKTSSSIADPLDAPPVVMLEHVTGEPVVAFDEKYGDYVSRSSVIRRQEVAKRPVVVDISQIHTTPGPNGDDYWAVIHADGNNMGITIGGILQRASGYEEGIRARRQVNANITSCYGRIMSRTLADLETFYVAGGGAREDFVYEFQIVHQAGDDINVFCNASLAIPFLHFMFKHLEGECFWREGDRAIPLYMCAGVAFVTERSSYHSAFKLAEECCRSAKTEAKKKENLVDGVAGNWIDFHVCPNPRTQALNLQRERAYVTNDGINLLMRPYCMSADRGTPVSYLGLLDRVHALQALDLGVEERRILKLSYFVGKIEFSEWLKYAKDHGYDLAGSLGEPLYTDTDGVQHAMWYDAMELADFLPAALGGEA